MNQELERLERRMERAWLAVVRAKGPSHEAEHLYDVYLVALEAYCDAKRKAQRIPA